MLRRRQLTRVAPKPRKKTAKKRSKKGRSRGGLKLLFFAFFIACILLAGVFYFADFKTEAKKSDNALVAGFVRYLGDKKNSEASSQKKNLSQKPSLLAPNISEKAAH